MTTYATSTNQPSPPIGGPPPTPPLAGGPPTQRTPRPRRAGILIATGALVTAAVATAATAAALANPITPARHTVNVEPPPRAEYSTAEVQSAKDTACSTWDRAARTTAAAGKTRASLGDATGGSSLDTEAARSVEKRTAVAQVAFLRTQISPATPSDVRALISDWMATQIDSMHGVNIRDWKESNAATTKGNDLVDIIDAKCGFN